MFRPGAALPGEIGRLFWLLLAFPGSPSGDVLFLTPDGELTEEKLWDGVHLTPASYEDWAQAIEPKVKELMAP